MAAHIVDLDRGVTFVCHVEGDLRERVEGVRDDAMDAVLAEIQVAVDVAAFALRVASWSMERPRSRPVLIMDEPLRFLSTDHQEKASVMIKEISQKLGIQFIIVTHETILASYADKVFETKIKKGVTTVS